MSALIKTKTQEILLEKVIVADSFMSRFKGLMGRKSLPDNEGMVIAPCNSVHCFFMKFPIDVIFMDKNKRIIHIISNMKPGRISPIVREAKYVVEANANTLSRQVSLGDEITLL